MKANEMIFFCGFFGSARPNLAALDKKSIRKKRTSGTYYLMHIQIHLNLLACSKEQYTPTTFVRHIVYGFIIESTPRVYNTVNF